MIYAAIAILGIVIIAALGFWIWKYYYNIPQVEKKFASTFFVKNVKQYQFEDLVEVKKIHNGYTNLSFLIKTKDNQQYQLRFAKNNEIVDRNNEQKIILFLKKQDYLYLDKYGNYIKKWIIGENLDINSINEELISKLINKINKFHEIDVRELDILRHDYNKVLNSTKIAKKYLDKYRECLHVTTNKEWIFSHNDLNPDNILIAPNKDIIFIDFEWSRINHPDWDIINFARETNFSFTSLEKIAQQANISKENFFKMYFICLCFAYNWTFENSFSYAIWKYRLKTKKKLVSAYRFLEKSGF